MAELPAADPGLSDPDEDERPPGGPARALTERDAPGAPRADRHACSTSGSRVVERDSSIGGGLLAGALAYRLFVLLLPERSCSSPVSVYADAVDQSPSRSARGSRPSRADRLRGRAERLGPRPRARLRPDDAGRALRPAGSCTAPSRRCTRSPGTARGGPSGSRPGARPVRWAPSRQSIDGGEIVGWFRGGDQLGGRQPCSSTSPVVGGSWLAVSLQLPHRDARWPALVPGAGPVRRGPLFVNAFNVYVTTRLLEGQADTYGALGIAAALLFSLVLVGRLIVSPRSSTRHSGTPRTSCCEDTPVNDVDVARSFGEAARYWWIFLVTGLAGSCSRSSSSGSTARAVPAISILFGIVVIAAAVTELVAAFARSGWWGGSTAPSRWRSSRSASSPSCTRATRSRARRRDELLLRLQGRVRRRAVDLAQPRLAVWWLHLLSASQSS